MRFNSVAPQTLGVRVKFDLHTASIVDGELQCLMSAAWSQMLHIDVLGLPRLDTQHGKPQKPLLSRFRVIGTLSSGFVGGRGCLSLFWSELCRYTSSISPSSLF